MLSYNMTSPNVTIYRNGDVYFPGVRLVVNKKQIRTFDCFLDKVTHGTRSKVAVRSICTPNHGHRVNNLEQLESGGVYVALGAERFKKLEYSEIQEVSHKKTRVQQSIVKPVIHSRVIVSARCKKAAALEPLANKIVFVYRNGDSRHPGTKLLLNKRLLCDMEKMLQYITDKINLRSGAVRALYTVDGHLISACDQIQSGLRYVAVGYGARFIRLAYTEGGILSLTPQRGVEYSSTSGATNEGHEKGYLHRKQLKRYATMKSTRHTFEGQDKGAQRRFQTTNKKYTHNGYVLVEDGERSTNEHDPDALRETKEKGVQAKIQKGIQNGHDVLSENSLDDDSSTLQDIYKASGQHGEKATPIKDSTSTKVDKPIDMMTAEEVGEDLTAGTEN